MVHDPNASAPVVELDDSQRAVLEAPADAALVVVGAPGSGKTTTLVELLAHRVESDGFAPGEVLALAPGRTQATALRDRIAARVGGTVAGPRARTPQSLAFEIVREHRAATRRPAPVLLTGADQAARIRELIEGRGVGAALSYGFHPPITDEVLGLVGFRSEFRDLVATMHEYDVVPLELAQLAEHRDAWRGAAALAAELDEVEGQLADNSAFDVPGLLLEASSLLHTERVRDRHAVDGVRLVVVDDAQELTEATRRLLVALERRGVTVVTFGDPDIATGVFRGGAAERATGWRPSDEPAPSRLVLSTVHRHATAIRDVVAAVTGTIGARGEARQRAAEAAGSAPEGAVSTALAPTPVAEARTIAAWLRRLHLERGVDWNDMAVLVRSSGQVPALARLLARDEVPTTATRRPDPGADLAVRALVRVASLAPDPESITGADIEVVLASPLFGVDGLRMRQLRRALVRRDRETGGNRSSDELLVEVVLAPAGTFALEATPNDSPAEVERTLTLPFRHPAVVALRRLASIMASVTATAVSGAADEVLWAVWEGADVAETWRRRALGGGAEAAATDERLDAVVALFDAAKRAVERTPDLSIAMFVEEWEGRTVAADSLGGRSARAAVTLATPASVTGREFRAVAVAGVNDGVWPNLRVRDSLLGAQHLAEVVEGAVEPRSMIDCRRDVLFDESRMFAQALSRAREALLVTAVEGEDAEPSVLFRRIAAERLDPERVALPSTLRSLTGHLRRELRAAHGAGADPGRTADAADAVAGLARLAREGVPGAHPSEWLGLRDWSTTRLVVRPQSSAAGNDDAGYDVVRVSPSGLEVFETCGLKWFVERYGGGSTSVAMSVGTLVHAAAEFDFADAADRLEYVRSRMPELEAESPWRAAALTASVESMVDALQAYLEKRDMVGATVLGAERPFDVEFDLAGPEGPIRVVLSGKIDRIERDPTGQVAIIDFKTGKTKPSKDELTTHSQLAAYQFALRRGVVGAPRSVPHPDDPAPLVDSGGDIELPVIDGTVAIAGASLVMLALGRGTQLDQATMDDEAESAFFDRLATIALGMAGAGSPPDEDGSSGGDARAQFTADPAAHCENAHGRTSHTCRIHVVPEVTE